ncbi:unnamed protein product [Rotaria sordida]|uniref:Uncharacterized protein n=1 Tax=Rotaria sordida TaxID=392033 RepID=A0A813NYS4_9BILA|nr:unnamed protein product [Rotaria sordida]CAF0822969.1 unnamed protein product [Rotaria sordida]CAF3675307.1 unnamed protein product [Rotaria sordida]CAF4017120.1 unnamed protein product [Rotaria sordida]
MNWLRTAASAYSNILADPEWPKYDVLESNKLYEKRYYYSFTCVAYMFTAKAGDEPVMSNLWKLVKYTQGENVDGKILKICLPIMVKVRPLLTADEENQFTIMLLLDKDNNINPPSLPTADGVFIYHQSEQIFYAKRFGGFAKENDWKRESSNILELCKTLPINREEVISATYDMPTKLFNRHNEVLVAEIIENVPNKTTVDVC